MNEYSDPLNEEELKKIWIKTCNNDINSTPEKNYAIIKVLTPLLNKLWESTNLDDFYLNNLSTLGEYVAIEFNKILNEASNMYDIQPYKNSKLEVLKRIQGSLVIEIIFSQINNMIKIYPFKNIPLYYIYTSFYIPSSNIFQTRIRELLVLPPPCLFDIKFKYRNIDLNTDNYNNFVNIIKKYNNFTIIDPYIPVILESMVNHLIKIFSNSQNGLNWLNTLPFANVNNEDFGNRLNTQLPLILSNRLFNKYNTNNELSITMLINVIMEYGTLNEKLFAGFTN